MIREALTFDEAAHVYWVQGHVWPGVTQCLDPITKLEFVDHDILHRAAELGKHVHKAVHLYDIGQLDEDCLDPVIAGYLAGWKRFLSDTGARIRASELAVLHPQHRYCGTLDKIIDLISRRMVLDVKTSLAVPRTVWPQTAAYLEALVAESLAYPGSIAAEFKLSRRTDRGCLVLEPEGTYKLRRPKGSLAFDFNMFISCLNVQRWRAES